MLYVEYLREAASSITIFGLQILLDSETLLDTESNHEQAEASPSTNRS